MQADIKTCVEKERWLIGQPCCMNKHTLSHMNGTSEMETFLVNQSEHIHLFYLLCTSSISPWALSQGSRFNGMCV